MLLAMWIYDGTFASTKKRYMSEQSKNLKKYIIPAMLANVSFFILTIIDGMFVGNGVGTDALGAVNLALPFVMIISVFAVLFNIGGITVTAIRMGRGDIEGANQAFLHSLMYNVSFALCMTFIGTVFPDKIAVLLGANQTYKGMVSDYIFWYSVFILPTCLFYCFNGFARNDGNPQMSIKVALTCMIVNIIGDWITVYPLQMGVKGAAIATGVAGCAAFLVASTHYWQKKGNLRIRPFKVQFVLLRKILLRGLPEMISETSVPLTAFSMNYMLITYLGNASVNAFSAINYTCSLFASLMWGLATGLQPLYGLSYGAKDDYSLHYYFRSGRRIALIGGLAIFALTFVIGAPICRLFGVDAASTPIVIASLPKFCLNFVFAAMSTVVSAYLYSTKRTQYAIPLNICRGVIFNVLCINTLPLIFGYDFVWYSMAVAEAICLILAIVLQKMSEKNGIIYR